MVLIGLVVTLAALCCVLAVIAVHRHLAFRAIRAEERSFRDLYDNINEGVFRSTLDGRMISANPALVRLNGYRTEAEMLRGVNDIAAEWYVQPGRRAELHKVLLKTGRVCGLVSEVYRHKTRERIWIEESTRLVRDEVTGEPRYYDGTVREVTDAVERQEIQERLAKIASLISGCVYQLRVKPDGTMSSPYASVGFTKLFGLEPEDVQADALLIWRHIHPDDRQALMDLFAVSAKTLTPRQDEYRIIAVDGTEKWVMGQSSPEREADGSTLWHGFVGDITQRKRHEERIYQLAYFDALTGLPNRTALLERLQRRDGSGSDDAQWSALLFIDLDQFKVLNDTKGHDFGDRLLCEVADRLSRRVGDEGMVARFGGDEFVVLYPGLSMTAGGAADSVARRAKGLQSVITLPFVLDDFTFGTTASIGIALYRDGEQAVDDLLRRADVAMYEAKSTGGGAVRLFQSSMQRDLEERLSLTTDLRHALERDELTFVYQPQVDGEGNWTGAEALIRWQHPARGLIGPDEFLPLAKRGGLAAKIDAFAIRSAARTLKEWQGDPRTAELKLAVNISAEQFGRRELITMVEEAIDTFGVDPRKLTIELTEHAMLENIAGVGDVMLRLKKFGVGFALDDFGTGYSSLTYLKQLPIDLLKIDRSFIRDIEHDVSDRAIVQTILNMARTLDVSVIAEGVENDIQAMLLRQFGCYAYQGFYFARPMSREAFAEAFLRPHRRIGGQPPRGDVGLLSA